MKCEYCLTDKQTGDYCERCGAKIPASDSRDWKSGPFFYNGYICYSIRHYETYSIEVQFWLGHDLIERIDIPIEIVEQYSSPNEDYMSFFWDLFLVARGEKEVIERQEKNKRYPARFEIRRVENPEKEYFMSMDRYAFVKEFQNGT